MHIVSLDIILSHYLIGYSINMTFNTGKPKVPDLLYCNICFITVVWNWTHNTSDVS